MRKLYNSIQEASKGGLQPQNFEEFISHIHRSGGFWHIVQRDKLTGEIQVEQFLENAWTDNAVSQMYDAVLRASAPTQFTPANIMVISQTLGFTTLAANIAAGGTVTSIQVGALTGPTIPSGTKLMIDPAGQAFNVTLTQSITGSGTFTVTSTPGPISQINSGAAVRYDYTAVPTADPSSISAPVSYTNALSSGQFTKTITTGYGNRQIQVNNSSAFIFSTTGSPAATAASYTTAYMANTNPISANNQTVLVCVFDALAVVNSTTTIQINLSEKL